MICQESIFFSGIFFACQESIAFVRKSISSTNIAKTQNFIICQLSSNLMFYNQISYLRISMHVKRSTFYLAYYYRHIIIASVNVSRIKCMHAFSIFLVIQCSFKMMHGIHGYEISSKSNQQITTIIEQYNSTIYIMSSFFYK